MESLEIDFDKLEIQQWNNYSEEQPLRHLRKFSSRVSAQASADILNQQPFSDYSSFVSYAAHLEIDIVPNTELKWLERLGSGATRTVFKGLCPSRWKDTGIAIKRLNLEIPRTQSTVAANVEEFNQQLAEASLEARVLSNSILRYHPNIVDLLAISWEDMPLNRAEGPSGKPSYPFEASVRPLLLVELAYDLHPTLEDYYSHVLAQNEEIPMDMKVSLISDVADALAAVHTYGVVHGDIKPQNILIFRRQNGALVAKLSDFGGCKLPEPSDERSASGQVKFAYSLAGTEYWNAPEAASRDDPAFGLETRDYYSLGLLAFYVLFEAPPFGEDGDFRDENTEMITAIKNDDSRMRDLLREKFQSRWRLLAQHRDWLELTSLLGFYERQEKLQKLLKNGQAMPVYRDSGGTWIPSITDECRQYSFYFIMSLLLRREPQTRKQPNLMSDLRYFLGDGDTAKCLMDVYLMQAWSTFTLAYDAKSIDLWDIRALFKSGQPGVVERRRLGPPASNSRRAVLLGWIDRPLPSSIERETPFSPLNFVDLPHRLQALFMKEAHSQLPTSSGSQLASLLLSLAYCKALGIALEGEKSRNYSLEAARLGSFVGKYQVLTLSEAKLENVDFQPGERMQWMLDVLLKDMPRLLEFLDRTSEAVPELRLRQKIVTRVFESECLMYGAFNCDHVQLDGQSALISRAFDAARTGNLSLLKLLLKDDSTSLLSAKVGGYNLLHIAAENGQSEVARMLVHEYGMPVDSLTSAGLPPTVLAFRATQFNTLQALIPLGADYKRLLGAQTLRNIANYGSAGHIRWISEFVKVFNEWPQQKQAFPLKAYLDGAFSVYPEIRLQREPGFPPIFTALLGHNIATLLSLLKLGCSTDLCVGFNSGVLAPIHIAANLLPLHMAVLLHFGADPDQRTADRNLWTALHLACVAFSIPYYLHPHISPRRLFPEIPSLHGLNRTFGFQPEDFVDAKLFMARILVRGYGADVNAQDWVGRTPLSHCMSGRGALPVARLLVGELGADIKIKDFRNLSCLHRAIVHKSSVQYIEFCVAKGLDVNERDIQGMTPLMMAAMDGNAQFCQKLIDLGADVLARSDRGQTSLHIAVREGRCEAADTLFACIKRLGLLPVLIEDRDIYRQTLLHRLVQFGAAGAFSEKYVEFIGFFSPQLVQHLLHHQDFDILGFTLLHHAVIAQNLHAIRYLLEHGADVNVKGWRGMTPLHLAFAKREHAAQKLLKEFGSDLTLYDEEGRMPSDYSAAPQNDPGFWNGLEAQMVQEGFKLSGRSDGAVRAGLDAIEEENRARARAAGGW